MKFIRQFAVATLVIAVVVALSVVVDHLASGALIGSPGHGPLKRFPVKGRRARGGVIVLPPGGNIGGLRPGKIPPGVKVIHAHGFDLGLTSMFDSVNWPYLRHTVVIEVGVLAAVVVLDVIRRKWRRARRARQARQDSQLPAKAEA
jgi:hypothetical protein